MKEQMNHIIENFRKRKILVVGDAVLDTYVQGSIDRICREAPVPIFNVHNYIYSCGGAANTAINLAALGAETYFLTVLGKDANARELLEILRKNNVHTEFILQDKSRKTIAKKRVTASSNIILRLDEGTTSDINETCEKELLQKLFETHEYIDAILLSDYGLGVITDTFISSLKTLTVTSAKPLVVDSKDASRFKNIHPTAVKPNYEETVQLLNISKISGKKRVEQVIKNSGALLDITGAGKVAITLDVDGVVLLQKGQDPYKIACAPQDSKNTIGAGDTFTSALTLALASGLKIKTAAEIAAAAAAIVVQKDGTGDCSNSELKAYFKAIPKYISNVEDLLFTIKELKRKGKKIVFTNGCFDIIHKGHIALLNKAREAGDILIVGVNNDESVRKVKGPERPINNLEDRITVLAGLQSTDYLIAFAEESPLELIKTVHPDVFVKGADYTETSIPEFPLLKKIGCTVKIIPCVEDISTTDIIHRINDISDGLEVRDNTQKPRKIIRKQETVLLT